MPEAKILVVEDEGIVAEDIKQVLKKLRYNVVGTVAEGDKAVEFAASNAPDLVLMDIVLKGDMTGIEAAEQISNLNIPVIYLTAYADENTLEKAKITAPFGFILKPFEEQSLKSTIEMAIYKHQMEQKLREKELWFSTTLISIGDGVIATDSDGKVIFTNSVAEKLTGWVQEHATGHPLEEIFNVVNEKDGDRIEFGLEDVLKKGRVKNLPPDTYLISRNGQRIAIDDSIAPIKDKVLGIIGAVVVFHDIVERKLVERALKESEERYRSLFEESHDAIYITTCKGNFVLVNQSALNLFMYSKEEIVKLNLEDLFVNKDKWKEFKNRIELTGSVKDYEVEFYNKKREILYCILTASLRQDNESEVLGYQGIIRDITEKKNSEMEREKIKAQLLQAQKMEAVGVLAGGVAHDFNNILTVIQGNLDLALMRFNKDNDMELYKDIIAAHDASLRAADLTSQLLLFSRKKPLRFVKENLNQIIEDMLKMLHRLIGEDISIKTDFDPDLYTANIDRGSLEQLLMNLAVNARDAMPNGGEIKIRTSNAGEDSVPAHEKKFSSYVMLSMSDTGSGIDKDIIEHIFDPFFSTKGPGKGTGLGLSVVYGVVQQHDGWINVDSKSGEGTTFNIFIPVYSEDIENTGDDRIETSDLKGHGEHILIVEDEEGVREFMGTILRKSGYCVVEAENIKKAEDLIESERKKIKLILCDVVLTDGNGMNLLKNKTIEKNSTPIVFCSGYTGEKSRWETIRDKGIPFLQKPFTIDELLVKIKDTLS